jgi:PhnB protein
MKLNPHLAFNGQCEAAFKFYQKCLGGEIITMMSYADASMVEGTQADWGMKIIHATLAMGDQVITGADVTPDCYQAPQGFSVLLHLSSTTEANRIFEMLSENGRVTMPLQETFWSAGFGILVDQFGVSWMINCKKPD